MPQTGIGAFTESGTYAPVYCVGPYEGDDGQAHVFLCDGYAASAEAMQGASLDQIVDTQTSMCMFSSHFTIPYDKEQFLMRLDPEAADFASGLSALFEEELDEATIELYRGNIRDAADACMPVGRRVATADDFFPTKMWRILSLSSGMLADPYTGNDGVEEVGEGVYRVTTRAATKLGQLDVTLTLRLADPMDEMQMVFSPLLDRFYAGQDYRTRAVKVSDSGRIRNELQTLVSEAIEYLENDCLRVNFEAIDDAVMAPDKKALIQEILGWYKENHPIWFRWLEI